MATLNDVERLKNQLEAVQETNGTLYERALRAEDKLLAIAAALGLKVERSVPSMDDLLRAVSSHKFRGTQLESTIASLGFEIRVLESKLKEAESPRVLVAEVKATDA